MKIIAIAVFMISFSLQAKVIVLELSSTFRNNKMPEKKTSTIVKAEIGKTFKIPLGSTKDEFLQVNVSEKSNFPDDKDFPKDILFSTQILKIVDGKEIIISSPNVTTVLGIKATITQKSKDQKGFLEIDILPTKFIE